MTNYKSLYLSYQTFTWCGLFVIACMWFMMKGLLAELNKTQEELRYYKIHSTLNTTMPIAPKQTEVY